MDKMARGFLTLAFSVSRPRVRKRVLVVAAALTFTLAPPIARLGRAARLAPSKASSVIELNSLFGSGTAKCPFGGVAADSLNNADGTTTSGFTVPARKVFVITDVDFQYIVARSDIPVEFRLVRETSTAGNTVNTGLGAVSSTGGSATATLSLHGAVVKPGVTLCVACFDLSTRMNNNVGCTGTVHGFLDEDS